MVNQNGKAAAILGIGGAGIVGTIYLANRYTAGQPGGSAPEGTAQILAAKSQAKVIGKTLFSLPNDVKFTVSGTVTAGVPAPNATILFLMTDQFNYENAGAFKTIATVNKGIIAVGQSVSFATGVLAYSDLIAVLGYDPQGPVAAYGVLRLVNSSGTKDIPTSVVTADVTNPNAPMFPQGTASISAQKMARQRQAMVVRPQNMVRRFRD